MRAYRILILHIYDHIYTHAQSLYIYIYICVCVYSLIYIQCGINRKYV